MIKKIFFLFAGFAIAAIVTEVTLHLFPVSTGNHFQPVNNQLPTLQGEPGFLATSSLGYNFRLAQKHKLNNFGYVNNVNYQTDTHPVLIIGDSFIQAAMLKEEESISANLSKNLKFPVYSLGQSGGAISDYLGILEWGIGKFSPSAVVMAIQHGDVTGALNGEVYHFDCARTECLNHRTDIGGQSALKKLLNSSMLFRYFFDNLKFFDHLQSRPKIVTHNEVDLSLNCRVIDFFLGEVERIYGKEKIVFTVDAPSSNKDTDELNLFETRAKSQGFNVVNLADSFAKQREKGVRLDFLPTDGHWNANAHQIAAEKVLPSIKLILNKAHGSDKH